MPRRKPRRPRQKAWNRRRRRARPLARKPSRKRRWITDPIIKALTDAKLNPHLFYTHPAGYLNTYITLGVYLGIVLASPVVLYQIWLFVAPALYKHERSAVTGFLFFTVLLFLMGIAFGYFVTLPYILRFLVSFQGTAGPISPMITA